MSAPYKRILVPLDSSPLSELAVPEAVAVSRAFGGELTLLHVLAPMADVLHISGYDVPIDEQLEVRTDQALRHLAKVRDALAGGVTAHLDVQMGPAASTILARSSGFDLLVMATHGRSGVGRWVLGSVAEKVLRGAPIPILLVRALGV